MRRLGSILPWRTSHVWSELWIGQSSPMTMEGRIDPGQTRAPREVTLD